jgi:hypothetical protein
MGMIINPNGRRKLRLLPGFFDHWLEWQKNHPCFFTLKRLKFTVAPTLVGSGSYYIRKTVFLYLLDCEITGF